MADDPLALPQDEFEVVRSLLRHLLPGAVTGRMREDAAAARKLLTSALLAEVARRILDYENAIDWNTSCTGCAKALDRDVAETFRREVAEANLAAIAEICREPGGHLERTLKDRILAIIDTEEESRG